VPHGAAGQLPLLLEKSTLKKRALMIGDLAGTTSIASQATACTAIFFLPHVYSLLPSKSNRITHARDTAFSSQMLTSTIPDLLHIIVLVTAINKYDGNGAQSKSHIGVSVPCQIEFKYTRTKLQIHRVAATMASIGKGNLNFIMLHVPSSYNTKRQQFGGVSGMSCCRIYRTTHYQLMPYNNSLL
jgi:hypothetical protein